jgi:hypothetical protein
MTNILPSHFQDAVQALLDDWRGQDEMFYHDKSMRTIIWYVGKVKSYLAAERDAEIRTHRQKFMEAVCAEYGMQPRRLHEALAVYKKYAQPSDSLMETSERIFQAAGGWSKALPPKKEAEVEEQLTCGRCPIHCKHDDQR